MEEGKIVYDAVALLISTLALLIVSVPGDQVIEKAKVKEVLKTQKARKDNSELKRAWGGQGRSKNPRLRCQSVKYSACFFVKF